MQRWENKTRYQALLDGVKFLINKFQLEMGNLLTT